MLLGCKNNSFSSAAIALRTSKLDGGVKTPRLTQFHGMVISPPMLQLGDKGARQGKKNFSQTNLALGSTAIDVLGRPFRQSDQARSLILTR
jgi:hypothetical protein